MLQLSAMKYTIDICISHIYIRAGMPFSLLNYYFLYKKTNELETNILAIFRKI